MRDFLLAVHREGEFLDDAIAQFTQELTSSRRADSLAALFTRVHPHLEPLFQIWHDVTSTAGGASRWKDRASVALHMEAFAFLVEYLTEHNQDAAEAVALRTIRERSACLEKQLTWSDKPGIVCRTLQLMTAIVRVNGSVARELVRVFNFDSAVFQKLAMRRFKSQQEEGGDGDEAVNETQVRSAYVFLVVALAECADPSVHRFVLKEGSLVGSLFKAIDCDSSHLLSFLFDKLVKLVLGNEMVDRNTKWSLFNSQNVERIMKLLQSDSNEIADGAMHFLNVLFLEKNALFQLPSKSSIGLLLLPQSSESTTTSLSVSSRMLTFVVRSVGLAEIFSSPPVEQFLSGLFVKYPALSVVFLKNLSLTLEPRLTYRWFSVASFVSKVLCLPIQEAGEEIAEIVSAELLAHLVVPLNARKELTRGIQHSSPLVVYTTLGVLQTYFKRLESVTRVVRKANDLEQRVRSEFPSPDAIISLLMRLCGSWSSVAESGLLYARALSVFRLYFQNFSRASMAEIKVDLSKLCRWELLSQHSEDSPRQVEKDGRLLNLILGEILLLLCSVESTRLLFLLSCDGKPCEQMKLYRICRYYAACDDTDLRMLCKQLIARLLQVTGVFGVPHTHQDMHEQTIQDEVAVWSDSLRFCDDSSIQFFLQVLEAAVHDPLTNVMKFQESGSVGLPLSPVALAMLRFYEHEEAIRSNGITASFVIRTLFGVLLKCLNPLNALRLLSRATSASTEESLNGSSRKRRRVEHATMDSFECFKHACSLLLSQRVDEEKSMVEYDPLHKPIRDLQLDLRSILNLPGSDVLSTLDAMLRQCAVQERDQKAFDLIYHYFASNLGVDLFSHPQLKMISTNPQIPSHWARFLSKMPLDLLVQAALLPAWFGAPTRDQPDDIANRVKFIESTISSRFKARQVSALEAGTASELLCLLLSGSIYRSDIADLVHRLVAYLSVVNPPRSSALFDKIVGIAFQSSKRTTEQFETLIACSLSWPRMGKRTSWDRMIKGLSFPSLLVVVPSLPLKIQSNLLRWLVTKSSRICQLLTERLLVSVALNPCTELSKSLGRSDASQLWRFLTSTQLCAEVDPNQRVMCAVLQTMMLINRAGGVTHPSGDDLKQSVVPFLIRLLQLGCVSRAGQFVVELLKCFQSQSAKRMPLADMLFDACRMHPHIKRSQDAKLSLICTWISAFPSDFGDFKRDELAADIAECSLDLMDNNRTQHNVQLFLMHYMGLVSEKGKALEKKEPCLSSAIKYAIDGCDKSPSQDEIGRFLLLLLICLRNSVPIPEERGHDVVCYLVKGVLSVYKQFRDSSANQRVRNLVQAVMVVLKSRQLSNVSMPKPLSEQLKDTISTCTSKPIDVVVEISYVLIRAIQYDAKMAEDHLKQLVAHPEFDESIGFQSGFQVRVLRLILRLVHQAGSDPISCDRVLHMKLLRVYSCSLSRADRIIKAILDLNIQRDNSGLSNERFGYRFGSSATKELLEDSTHVTSESLWFVNDAVDTDRIRATIDFFPIHCPVLTTSADVLRLIDSDEDGDDSIEGGNETQRVYDPGFFLPLLAHLISSSDLGDNQLVQLGLVGIAIRSTSSICSCVREYAYGILAHMHETVSGESNELKANRQIFLLLETLRNAIGNPYAVLPSVITVFLNDAVSILTRPAHVMFPQVNHFLLARPAIDVHDVPMFYTLFNSHSPLTYKQERSWFLHFLRRSVMTDQDVDLLAHRHVLEILMSFFSSPLADEYTQELVLRVFVSCEKTDKGFRLLVNRMGMFEWLAQLYLQQHSPRIVETALLLHSNLINHVTPATTGQKKVLVVQILNALNALLRWRKNHRCTMEVEVDEVVEQIVKTTIYAVGSFPCSLRMMETIIESLQPTGRLSIPLIKALVGFCVHEGIASISISNHPDLAAETITRWAWVVRHVWETLDAAIRDNCDEDAREVAAALRVWVQQTPLLRQSLLQEEHRQHRAFACFV